MATFFQIYHGKPDFYGPFWILTTLILEMGTLSNLQRYLNDSNNFVFQPYILSVASVTVDCIHNVDIWERIIVSLDS